MGIKLRVFQEKMSFRRHAATLTPGGTSSPKRARTKDSFKTCPNNEISFLLFPVLEHSSVYLLGMTRLLNCL